MIARAIVVLPQPDSPASASTSPSWSVRSTPSTARRDGPFFLGAQRGTHPTWNLTSRPRPRLRGRPRQPRAERRATSVRSPVVSAPDGAPETWMQAARRSSPAAYRPGRPSGHRPRSPPGISGGTGIRSGCAAGRAGRPQSGRLASEPRVADLRERSRQRFRVGMSGLVEDRLGRTLLDDLTRVHDRDPVRDLDQDREVVGDEEHRESELSLETLQEVQHLRLHHHIECRRGFVGDHERRVTRERHRDHHALLLPTRELVRVVVDAPSGQANLLEERAARTRASSRRPACGP